MGFPFRGCTWLHCESGLKYQHWLQTPGLDGNAGSAGITCRFQYRILLAWFLPQVLTFCTQPPCASLLPAVSPCSPRAADATSVPSCKVASVLMLLTPTLCMLGRSALANASINATKSGTFGFCSFAGRVGMQLLNSWSPYAMAPTKGWTSWPPPIRAPLWPSTSPSRPPWMRPRNPWVLCTERLLPKPVATSLISGAPFHSAGLTLLHRLVRLVAARSCPPNSGLWGLHFAQATLEATVAFAHRKQIEAWCHFASYVSPQGGVVP